MSANLQYECVLVPVTALSTCGPLFVTAIGPFVCFYKRQDYSYLWSRQIFEAQAIHGISVVLESTHHVVLVVWGGLLVRTLELRFINNDKNEVLLESFLFSNVIKSPDWILDLGSAPTEDRNGSSNQAWLCAAVTAHNALLELSLWLDTTKRDLAISIVELTSSSRSILYSAHLLWDSRDRILIAAGTAFGEIMYWSWSRQSSYGRKTHTHRVFLGHEGSIFGVRISEDLRLNPDQNPQRLLASCSDDRTIRIWNVSDNCLKEDYSPPDEGVDEKRERHTGFSNASFDATPPSSECLAVGWGHLSRVWTVQFLNTDSPKAGMYLLSSGEDASCRLWRLFPDNSEGLTSVALPPYNLQQLECAAYHSGKNIWSVNVASHSAGLQHVVMGGADSKIVACPLKSSTLQMSPAGSFLSEYTIEDIASPSVGLEDTLSKIERSTHKSSKATEFFRSYAFIDDDTFLLTTNSGKVFIKSLHPGSQPGESPPSQLVGQLKDLTGYSVAASECSLGIAFVAGSKGGVYLYQKGSAHLVHVHDIHGKVGDMFVAKNQGDLGVKSVTLLITQVAQARAQLLYLNITKDGIPVISAHMLVSFPELLTGTTVTSMEYIPTSRHSGCLLLGFRRGSIAAWQLPPTQVEETATPQIFPFRVIERAHSKEAVTSLSWVPSSSVPLSGHLMSTGRDGCLSIHSIDFTKEAINLVDNLTLPFGPNVEGIDVRRGHVFVYGFSSKNFILYDYTAEEEIMNVNTGGAHRSWAFNCTSEKQGNSTLVWTRASSLHVCHQVGLSHQVIRSGAHGREIKAVAVSPIDKDGNTRQYIATGAEDTDIKIFEYDAGEMICRRTLRKHTTGIQHLRWSNDGEYLFSSGGCEEFYIWRVRSLPTAIGGTGVVCESIYKPESEYSDLRIMSFDVQKRECGFLIAMVFSDSSIKVYSYEPTTEVKWTICAEGVYFTSCLTQCVFLSSDELLTAGTDGHAVLWPLASYQGSIDAGHPESLTWQQPARIHQNTSKTLTTHLLEDGTTTIVISGGDDGSLAFLVAISSSASESTAPIALNASYARPPIIVPRAHASAVTSCAMFTYESRIHILTSGNDQWVRLWEVIPRLGVKRTHIEAVIEDDTDLIEVRRIRKIKTNVADVSSMAILGGHGKDCIARVLICGVGMEIIRVDWGEF